MILPGHRYEEIKESVAQAFEHAGMKSLPVDPLAIAAAYEIEVHSYTSLGTEGALAARKLSEDGFKYELVNDDNAGAIHVLYNDERPAGRIRFTLLHELGHVLLGHQESSDVAEAEANFFAKFAIAPPCLVHAAHPSDYLELATIFGLSRECAQNSWHYYRQWLHVSAYRDYDLRLNRLFVVSRAESAEVVLAHEKRCAKSRRVDSGAVVRFGAPLPDMHEEAIRTNHRDTRKAAS